MNPRVQRWFKLIAAGASLLIAFLAGEVAVRALHLVHGHDPADTFPGLMELYAEDAQLGYVPRTNVNLDVPDETGKKHRLRTDENGVRVDSGDNSTAAARGDQPAIAVLGDSFVAGVNAPDGQTFPAVLSQRLGGRPALNFGCLGYSNFQELGLARRLAPRYHIGALVMMICSNNDLGDNLTWSRRNKINDFELRRPGSLHMLARKSQLLTFVTRSLKSHVGRSAWEDHYDFNQRLDKELIQYDAHRPPQAEAEYGAAVTASVEALAEFKRFADELGVPRLVVLIPAKAMVYREVLFTTDSQTGEVAIGALKHLTQRGLDFDALRGTWRDIAGHAGVPFLDLTDTFREHDREALYGQIDRHWNPTGMRLGAEVVAKAMADQKPLPSRETTDRDRAQHAPP